ncbi:hypothetical protein MGH68_16210 [Erysipelothrix sp. D19-032]
MLNEVDINDDLTDIKLIYQTKVDTTIYPSSITYVDYIMDQSSITRFLDYRYCDDMNDFPKEMTFKNYHNARRTYNSLVEHFNPKTSQKEAIRRASKNYATLHDFYMEFTLPIDENEYKYRKIKRRKF